MTVAFERMFGILERWSNNRVTPSPSKPHELSYRSNNKILIENSSDGISLRFRKTRSKNLAKIKIKTNPVNNRTKYKC